MIASLRAPAGVSVVLALVVGGCSWAPPVLPRTGPDPADAGAQVRPVTDAAVIGPYQSFRPVTPRSWREQNERVAPQPRP